MDLTQEKYGWTLVHFEDNFKEGLSKELFEQRIEMEHGNLQIKLDTELAKYELASIYLKDKRKILNAVIYDNRFIVNHLRYVALGGIARDRCSNFGIFIKPTIYDEFNFELSDILFIEAQRDFSETVITEERKIFGLLKTVSKRTKGDIETRSIIYDDLPSEKIKITSYNKTFEQ